MPDVAHGILCPRCGDGGPRIERPEYGAGGALVLSPTSVKEKSINTKALNPLHLLMHSHDGLLPVSVAWCILSSRRDSREGEKEGLYSWWTVGRLPRDPARHESLGMAEHQPALVGSSSKLEVRNRWGGAKREVAAARIAPWLTSPATPRCWRIRPTSLPLT